MTEVNVRCTDFHVFACACTVNPRVFWKRTVYCCVLFDYVFCRLLVFKLNHFATIDL